MKLFRRKFRTVEENVERCVNLLRHATDDLVIPINRFYRECRGEDGEGDAELVILGLQQRHYVVRVVERYGWLWNSRYIVISR